MRLLREIEREREILFAYGIKDMSVTITYCKCESKMYFSCQRRYFSKLTNEYIFFFPAATAGHEFRDDDALRCSMSCPAVRLPSDVTNQQTSQPEIIDSRRSLFSVSQFSSFCFCNNNQIGIHRVISHAVILRNGMRERENEDSGELQSERTDT